MYTVLYGKRWGNHGLTENPKPLYNANATHACMFDFSFCFYFYVSRWGLHIFPAQLRFKLYDSFRHFKKQGVSIQRANLVYDQAFSVMISDKSSRSSRSGSIAGNDLSAQMIRDNLSCLGKHPIAQSHAFLALSAVGEGIRDIGRIESYPNLMYINLSDNLIDSLKPLEFLPALVQIEARYSHRSAFKSI